MLLSTAGALVGTAGGSLGVSAACGCEAAGFKLGPAEVETYGATGLGAIEPGQEKEFVINNQTNEEVKIENVEVKQITAPIELEDTTAAAKAPKCTVGAKLAVAASCFARVKNKAALAGGVGKYVIEAKGAKNWKTEIEAF